VSASAVETEESMVPLIALLYLVAFIGISSEASSLIFFFAGRNRIGGDHHFVLMAQLRRFHEIRTVAYSRDKARCASAEVCARLQ